MSTSTPQPEHSAGVPEPYAAPPSSRPMAPREEILIVSHSSLFYWWPVWAVGFLMFILSMVSGYRLVVVPAGTSAHKESIAMPANPAEKKKEGAKVDGPRDALVYPAGEHLPPSPDNKDLPEQPHLRMSNNKNLGVFFCAVLLLVIVITNIPLRGLWSVIVIVFLVFLVIIFAILEWWEKILSYLNYLDIRINAGGYLVISAVLFGLWLIVMLLFDRQIYMIFTPGQMRVRQEIGDAEIAFDTTGMTIQKQRSDLFRHWILGIGSGDLIVRTGGGNPQEFHMNNVLFIGRKVKEIEDMLRSRQVVTGQG